MIAAFLDNSVPNSLRGAANSWVIHPPMLIPLGAGLAFGVLNLVFSPGIVILSSLGIGLFWLIAKYPEYGVLMVVAYTSSILSEEMVPLIGLGGVTLHPSDLVIGWLLLVLLWRVAVARDLRLRPTPLDLSILILVGVCFFSTLRGIAQGDTPFNSGFRDLRPMVYYLLYFPIIHLLKDAAAQRRLWKGLLILASLTSLAAVLQSAVGPGVPILPGRVESLYTDGSRFEEIARVIPPGESLIFLFLILTGTALAWGRGKADSWRKLALLGLLAMGLLLTYRRMLWGAAAVALLGAWLLVGLENRRRMIRRVLAGLTLTGLLLGTLWVAAPGSDWVKSLDATISRATTLFDFKTYERGDRDINTLEIRAVELEYLLPQILPPRFFGIGLGSPYRPCLPMDSDVSCQLPKFIHNGPVAILVRLGLVGFLAYLWICVATLVHGFGHWRRAESAGDRILVLGCTLTLTMIILSSLLEPYFLMPTWIPPIVVMLAAIMARTPRVQASRPRMAGVTS
jgi:hypothetical protein